ncbi:WhiB family redox-sensing transcriptional regulator [Pseudonocardia endophytica]|uniref:Transcriptional regulator WhiB n=1 Tax=Pseudonocardia endophytica TaxID=401976 RepID=A0A4R1HZ11_PSEEN|nr:WhiB family redox-sensing transcriptional regulator [Pseudonocardia endophytica]
MLVRSTPCEGGVVTSEGGGGTVAGALAGLLTATPTAGQDLPCLRGDVDADLWFAESPSALEEAKSLCVQCPIRAECLDGALSRGEPWGVWGGEILERGRVIPRKRPRGRPRKADLERDRAWALAAGA